MALWTPENISGKIVWLDASDASTLTLVANKIIVWSDKSGSGNDFQQIVESRRPIVGPMVNGLSTVTFDAVDDGMVQATPANLLPDQNYSIFVVYSANVNTGNLRVISGSDNALIGPYSGTHRVYTGTFTSGGTITIGDPVMVSLVGNGAAGAGRAHFDGFTGLATGGTTVFGTFAFGTGGLGSAPAGSDVFEVVAFPTNLTTEDRQKLEGYLAWKWGIQGKLPNTHPYAGAAPTTNLVVPVSIPNAPDGARYRIWNSTRNAEIENTLVSGGAGISTTFIADDESVPHLENDDVVIDLTYPVSTTAYLPSRVLGKAVAAGVSGFVVQVDDEIYNFHGIDGSALTIFDADFVDDEIDIIVSQNFVGAALYAFYVHSLTFEQGIREWLGAFTAIDNANFRVNVDVMSIKFDNDTTNNVWQTDNVRIFRSDGIRPVKHPTTGGGGIDVNWRSQVYTTIISTSAGVITGDIADVPAAVQTGLTSQGYTTARAAEISAIKTTTDSLPSAVQVADTVLRRSTTNVETSGTGDAISLKSLYGMIAQGVHNTQVSGTTLTVTQSDDTTVLGTRTVTTDASAEPIVGINSD